MDNKKKKRLIWWISGGSVALIILVVVLFMVFGKNNNPFVEVGKVKKIDKLVSIVTASGEIKPKNFVDIQSEIMGLIKDLYVKEGDHVKQGDILIKIDPIQTEADTRAAEYQLRAAEEDSRNTHSQIEGTRLNQQISEANLKSAEADLEQAKASQEQEEISFKRKQQLHEENLISREEYDLARSSLRVAQSQTIAAAARVDEAKTRITVAKTNIQQMELSYKSAISRVEQFKAMLTRQRDILSKTIIVAPLTGIITKLEVDTGERAVPGTLNNPLATLMTIADLSIIETEVKVDETDIIHVKMNQPVTIKVDALPDQPLKGHVTEIGNSAITAGQAVGGTEQAKDFKVVIQLDNPPDTLRPGLSATAEITTAVKNDVLAIPLQALIMREVELGPAGGVIHAWLTDKKAAGETSSAKKDKKLVEKQGVFIVDKEHRAIFTLVETGITGEKDIEVTKGLKEGEEIVVGSFKTLRTLKDGDTVIKKKADGKAPKEEEQ